MSCQSLYQKAFPMFFVFLNLCLWSQPSSCNWIVYNFSFCTISPSNGLLGEHGHALILSPGSFQPFQWAFPKNQSFFCFSLIIFFFYSLSPDVVQFPNDYRTLIWLQSGYRAPEWYTSSTVLKFPFRIITVTSHLTLLTLNSLSSL